MPVGIVHAQMAQELMATGTPVDEMLGKDHKGGLLPLSPGAAEGERASGQTGREVRALDRHLERHAEGKDRDLPTSPDARQRDPQRAVLARAQMDCEVAIAVAWVRSMNLVFDDNESMLDRRKRVKAEIRRRLRRALLGGK